MALVHAPVALLEQSFVQGQLIDTVLGKQWVRQPKKPQNWSLSWSESAARLWGYRLANTSDPKKLFNGHSPMSEYFGGFQTMSLFIVIVNKRAADVTIGLSDASARYGEMVTGPVVLGWDDEHDHDLELKTNVIPGAIPGESLWGVGVAGQVSHALMQGCGLQFDISLGDLPNETSIWFAAQNAYGSADGLYCSLALTNDHARYGTLNDFYDEACDNNRTPDASVTLLPGHGNDKSAQYTVTAHAAPMYAVPPDWAGAKGDNSRAWQYQVVIEIA